MAIKEHYPLVLVVAVELELLRLIVCEPLNRICQLRLAILIIILIGRGLLSLVDHLGEVAAAHEKVLCLTVFDDRLHDIKIILQLSRIVIAEQLGKELQGPLAWLIVTEIVEILVLFVAGTLGCVKCMRVLVGLPLDGLVPTVFVVRVHAAAGAQPWQRFEALLRKLYRGIYILAHEQMLVERMGEVNTDRVLNLVLRGDSDDGGYASLLELLCNLARVTAGEDDKFEVCVILPV